MQGTMHRVRKGDLTFRPSAYGIVIRDGKILLCKTRSTGKYVLPGGGVEVGETLEQALCREMMEECGIEVEVLKPFRHFQETFFFYEPLNQAWQCYLFVFVCKPLTHELVRYDLEDDSIEPTWVDPSSLKEEDFQIFGEEILTFLSSVR